MTKGKSRSREDNISLALDDYQDLFSDFDPRPHGDRAISHDFLQECRRASLDKPKSGVELLLLLPRKGRNKKLETTVKRRLLEHFRRHHDILEQERMRERHNGALWILVGLGLSMIALYLHPYLEEFWTRLLFVFAEPAGWFTIWTGFDHLFLEPGHSRKEREFYCKMAKAKIVFESY